MTMKILALQRLTAYLQGKAQQEILNIEEIHVFILQRPALKISWQEGTSTYFQKQTTTIHLICFFKMNMAVY